MPAPSAPIRKPVRTTARPYCGLCALLIPVLYVNQKMVLSLGAVSGVGHARLILERFGRFWGAFSVIDLFLLNTLTIVTEFIEGLLRWRHRCPDP
jgi:Natural resistance-associated macrophage protein